VDVKSSIREAILTNNTATDTDTGSGTRSVSISNSVSPISVQTGQNATYTIRVTNNGSAAVTDVVVTDTFSQYVDVSSASTSKGSRTISSRLVTVNVGTLNANQTATITVVVRANNVATANTTVSNTASMSYKFGSITYTGSATANFSLLRSSTLPGTGGIELSQPVKSQPPSVFYIALISAMMLAALGLASLGYGLVARVRQSDWSGWAIRMGLIFSSAALLFGLAALSIFTIANLEPQPTLVTLLKAASKDIPTQAAEQDPAWVGLAPPGEPQVLPDFPIPEPTNVPPPDENGKPPDTSPINRIKLPSLGVDTIVKYVPYDGFTWLIAGLQQEIAWMGDTSWPGLGGNTGLAGHVSLRNGTDGPFRYLDSLQPNDQIKLYTEENIYIYSVREKRVVTDTDFTVIEPTKDPRLTLITCTNWDPGTSFYRDRLIVIADLTGVEPVNKISQGN